MEYMAMSTTSKLLATTVTYPYQVLRSRLQARPLVMCSWCVECCNWSVLGCHRDSAPHLQASFVYRANVGGRVEGVYGFYKGLLPNALRVLPGTIITFVAYERISRFFREHAHNK
jgi:solute carrier family 25 folate transporter 32